MPKSEPAKRIVPAAAVNVWGCVSIYYLQRVKEQILQGIRGVQCYLDDIILRGTTIEQHLHTLDAVLERHHKYGLKANKTKCKLLQDTVEYCGHVISFIELHQVD